MSRGIQGRITTTKPHGPIDRTRLVERAMELIDAEGMDGLSMRRLASEFGIKAPSLYNHISGKDDLIDGVLERMRSEITLPPSMPDDWMATLGLIFGEYRRVLAAHPNMVSLAGRRLPGENESGIEYLVQQGFRTRDAVELFQALTALVVGFSLFSSGHAATDTSGLPTEYAIEVADWRDETCDGALRMIMEAYDVRRVG